ncbi:M20/M25/M40 family metallo-hydrolase [Chishuiella changwenlii]|uniref:M20/M25/M40 family metallo-hydrolase n=1 Tax=Chishuiella changwenlii TaxID=1434701 RepID=UPI002FDB1D2F
MKLINTLTYSTLLLSSIAIHAQEKLNPTVQNFVNEIETNSQLEKMSVELLDGIGPRLVGTPQMDQAGDWAIKTLKSWGIDARKEEYGTWKAWERGLTHVDMTYPRLKSIEATQLAWSPATKKAFTADVVAMPLFKTKAEFDAWLPKVKGKIVLITQNQRYGRSDYQYKEFGREELYKKVTETRKAEAEAWANSIKLTGYTNNTLPEVLEQNGAAAVAISNWTGIMGANRIFGAKTKKIPMLDISNEDYGLLYRLAESGTTPKLTVNAESKHNGTAKTFNIVGEIKGKEKPNEYIILSAHFDSWDGAQGATDNGTGTITMLETIRTIKKLYPNNKRTILICLWGSEEQGLNGSRAFVEDHPEIIKNTQAVFNQDNGTGRVVNINGSGFEKSYEYMTHWLAATPNSVRSEIKTDFPGMPSGGGSDHASFIAAGVPAFGLSSLHWGYFNYTWHTNKDTYDKIVFEEIQNNAILTATLTMMADQEKELVNREKRALPTDKEGKTVEWPEVKSPQRNSENYLK